MSEDRELLELAAKAQGWIDVPPRGCDPSGWTDPVDGRQHWADMWNPLERDGDAFRLAVKLNLTIDIVPWGVDCAHYTKFTQGGGATDAYQSRGDDHAAATRRAITITAANLGKAMP